MAADGDCFIALMDPAGNIAEGIFDGRHPMPGEVCDIVCTGVSHDGFKLKLRVREGGKIGTGVQLGIPGMIAR